MWLINQPMPPENLNQDVHPFPCCLSFPAGIVSSDLADAPTKLWPIHHQPPLKLSNVKRFNSVDSATIPTSNLKVCDNKPTQCFGKGIGFLNGKVHNPFSLFHDPLARLLVIWPFHGNAPFSFVAHIDCIRHANRVQSNGISHLGKQREWIGHPKRKECLRNCKMFLQSRKLFRHF